MPKKRVEFGRYYEFVGSKPAWMQGRLLLLLAIQKDGAKDDTDGAHITDTQTLKKIGGVGPGDLAMVSAWMPSKGRSSIITDQVEWGELVWLPDKEQPVDGEITVTIDEDTAPVCPRAPRKLKQV